MDKINKPRSKNFFISAAIMVVAFMFILGSSRFSNAKEKNDDSLRYYKYFTSIQVQEGDSLNTIASFYMNDNYSTADAYIEEVKHMNGLKDDFILSGGYLIIPYYSAELKDL